MIWLGLSLAFSLFYSLTALGEAFASAYVIQDDARQHVFWMRRFLDPELFPHDIIADYFQSVAPVGYTTLYRLFAVLGIDPVVFSKLLPIGIGLLSTVLSFAIATYLLPLPFAGFVVALLMNQGLWMRDDIVSGTPVAFANPLLLALLYTLLRRSLLPLMGVILLQGLFYPQTVFLSSALLLVRGFLGGKRELGIPSNSQQDRQNWRFTLAGLGTAFVVLLPYALEPSTYGPVMGLAEAKSLSIFSFPNGWSAFFASRLEDFWLCGKRSGMIPTEWCETLNIPAAALDRIRIPQFWLTPLLPILLFLPDRFPLAKQIRSEVVLLAQFLAASLGMFFLSHWLAFRLHLPNRYTEHSFRIIGAIAAGLVVVILWDAVVRRLARRSGERSPLTIGLTTLLGLALILYPTNIRIDDAVFPITGYVVGRSPQLYQFFAQQPKDSLIASISVEASKLPSFAQRSVLVGGAGYTLPYHKGYFREMSQRTTDLIRAQYSPHRAKVKQFIQHYGVDFWLLETLSFKPEYLEKNGVFFQFPGLVDEVRSLLQVNPTPALFKMARRCTVLRVDSFQVVDANCMVK